MTERTLTPDLAARLALAEAKLALIAEIDNIRDTQSDPASMLSAIVNVLSERFNADLCLMALIDRDLGHLELKAINDREGAAQVLGLTVMRTLVEQALYVPDVEVWSGVDWLRAAGHNDPPDDLHMAAVPIVMGTKLRLGAFLLVRRGEAFTEDDIALLRTAENHVDSAVIQGYDFYELQLRNRVIATIYKVDRIRDTYMPFDEMLGEVLKEIRAVIPAEMGFIMLYDQDQLETRAVSHDDLFRLVPYQEKIERIARRALSEGHMLWDNTLSGSGLRSIICIPLILRSEIIGVVGLVNCYRPGGFDDADRRLLTAIGSQMDTAIFESLEQRHLRNVLGRSVDPQVMEKLLTRRQVEFLKGERRDMTVLYADMRGSTGLAEKTDPELLVGYINDYLGTMADVIIARGATLDKFVGDEVMALFGAPFPMEAHALEAIRVGMEMQKRHRSIMEKWRKRGVDTRAIGVGIASGDLIAGEMGSTQRTDYTVIGPAANLGARLCSAAQAGQILISEETYKRLNGSVDVEPIKGMNLKGIEGDVTVYLVNGLR